MGFFFFLWGIREEREVKFKGTSKHNHLFILTRLSMIFKLIPLQEYIGFNFQCLMLTFA